MARAASRRAWISCRSFFDGSGARSSSAARMSRSARSPALSESCSLDGQRLHLPADLLQAPQVVLFLPGAQLLLLVLLLLERGDRALEPLGGLGIRRRVLAQHVGVAPQAAPARDDLVDRLLGRDQLLELGGQRLQAAGSGLRPASGGARDRRTRGTRPGTGGSATPRTPTASAAARPTRTFSSAMRSCASSPASDSISRRSPADRPARGRRPRARSSSAARSCCRSAMASRTASLAASNCCSSASSTSTSACSSAHASRTAASRATPRAGSAIATSASARRISSSARARSSGGQRGRRFVADATGLPLELPQLRARAPRRHLVAGALRDGAERVRVVDALERGHGRIGLLGLESHVHDFLRVGHSRQRAEPGRAVGSVPADRAERLLIRDQIDDGGPHVGSSAVAGDDHDLVRPAEHDELLDDRGGAARRRRLGGQAGEVPNGFGADVLVRIAARHFAEHGDVVEARHRSAPDSRFAVLARQRPEHVAFSRIQVIDRRSTDRGVCMLPAWRRTESFKNAHHGDALRVPGPAAPDPCRQSRLRSARHHRDRRSS